MTLADIAAACRSRAKELRAEVDLWEWHGDGPPPGPPAVLEQSWDCDALATLLDRLARVPMANSYPPYVDAAQRLARLAGVDL